MKPGKKPNRAIFWKKARTPKDPAAVIDKDLAKKFKKIVRPSAILFVLCRN